jgi:hypothetical protein
MRSVDETQGAAIAATAPRLDYMAPSDAEGWVFRANSAVKEMVSYNEKPAEPKWRLNASILGRLRETRKYADDALDAPTKTLTFSPTSDAGVTLAGMAPDDFPFLFQVVTIKLVNGRRTFALKSPDYKEEVTF